MGPERRQVYGWAAQGAIAPGRLHAALRAAGALPDASAWRRFLERGLLALGVLAIAASAVYFVAANWSGIGRYARFALAEGGIVAAVTIALWRGLDSAAGRAGLVAAALLTGALLALVGQTYQTGADPYELFAAWALAILPWAAVARMPLLWLIVVAIANVAIALYFTTFGSWLRFVFANDDWRALAAGLLVVDAAVLVAWELAVARGVRWLDVHWAPRLVAAAAGSAATVLAVLSLVETRGGEAVWLGMYAAWIVGCYGYYRHLRIDLFVLAGGVLSLVIAGTTGLARLLLRHGGDAGVLATIALFVVVASAGGALWLRRVGREAAR